MVPSGFLLLLKVLLVASIAGNYRTSKIQNCTTDGPKSSCHAHNAKLAEPANKAQTDYLINMAYIIGKGATYWLGGRDDVVEGTWQWSSSDNIITYKPWWTGQPDNAGGIEDCLEIWCLSANCNFNDRSCTDKNYFICERRYPGAEVVGK